MGFPSIPRPALLAAIFLLNFIEFFQTGMLVFAAGPIQGHIGAAPEEYAAISALYASVAVLSISQLTVLVQRLGWRNYLLSALLCFVLGAWLCAGSSSVPVFALGRVLMAMGGGVFMTFSRMLVNLIPPSPQRMQGIAAFGGALSLGITLGPGAAALMVGHQAWGGMFLALALAAIGAAALAARWLPLDAVTLDGRPSRLYVLDAVLLGAGAGLTMYAAQRLSYDWHGERLHVLALLAAGLVLLLAFGLSHARREQPFLQLAVLKSGRYRAALAIFSLCYVVLGLVNAGLPQLVQRALGVGFEQAGQLQTVGMSFTIPAFIVLLLMMKRRPHATKFYVTGFLMLALLGWYFSHLDPRAHAWDSITFRIGLFGGFLVLGMATTAVHGFKDFMADNVVFSQAQQLKNMMGQPALALGVGATGVLLQERSALHGARLAEATLDAGAPLAQQTALLAGMDAFWILMWVGLAGAALLLRQRSFD
ncbi:MFS transporter [Massilia sp. KIM]|uniref:MFS transporter n=1 Tax=Massilia sp. KIM TaxID=1955422 RepID=UPI00098FCDE1|nr:MFS transporter [Massilia sp. KIM]OON62831.1 MFS transporter [Massilia sp. KIM]